MWIRSQTKKDNVNTNNATNIFISGNNVYIAPASKDSSVCLGSYKDTKTAITVIEMILEAERSMCSVFEMPDRDYEVRTDTNMHEELKAGVVYAIKKLKYYFPEDNIDIHVEANIEYVDESKVAIDDGNASEAVE